MVVGVLFTAATVESRLLVAAADSDDGAGAERNESRTAISIRDYRGRPGSWLSNWGDRARRETGAGARDNVVAQIGI